MLIYILNLLLILALGYPLCVRRPSRRNKLIYLAITFGVLFLITAARVNIGNDYFVYLDIYHRAGTASMTELFSMSEEKGYLLLCKLLYVLGLGDVAMYGVMALLCLLPAAWFIYRYSPNVWLSVWLYVTLTFFYGNMNFIRQNIALAILLLGYPLLRQRRLLPSLGYAGVILIAACFHSTALIMLPILLVCHLPLNKWTGGICTAAALILYATSDYIIDFVTDYIYTSYKGAIYLELGFGFHFLIVPALLLLLCLLTKKQVEERYPVDGPLGINMMLFSFLIWLFITKHFVLERFSLFVYIYALLSIPMACETLHPGPERVQGCAQMKSQLKAIKSSQGAKSPAYKKLYARYQQESESTTMQHLYYWCLIGAVLVVTFCYHLFGMYDGTNGFHGVFPYRSLLDWLNLLP